MGRARYKCISCGYSEFVQSEKKDYVEVMPCPKCASFYVDLFVYNRYKLPKQTKNSVGFFKVDIDASDALKGLKAIERQAKKTARALREVEGLLKE